MWELQGKFTILLFCICVPRKFGVEIFKRYLFSIVYSKVWSSKKKLFVATYTNSHVHGAHNGKMLWGAPK